MKTHFDLSGRTAVITGGSRGLGREIALAFADYGADVVVASRKLDSCEAAAEEIRAKGRRALAVACHAGRWSELDALAETAIAEFGHVDILVNNAGMSPQFDASASLSEALFDKVMDVNFKGPFRLAAVLGAHMAAGRGGSIINVSSIAAVQPKPKNGPYASAKAALNTLTVALAREYAPKVRVNAILPGSFRTDIAKAWPPEREAQTTAALKRYGEPEEIVTAALYLASPASGFTTGSLITVDGGRG